MLDERYSKYLPWLLLLVVARFVWMPLIDARAESRQAYLGEQSRYQKTLEVIEGQQNYQQHLESLKQQLKQLESAIFQSGSEAQFRLEYQRLVESKVSALDIEVERFNWSTALDGNGISWQQVDMSLKGTLEAFANVHQRLIEGPQLVGVTHLEYRKQSLRGSDWDINGRVSLMVPVQIDEVSP